MAEEKTSKFRETDMTRRIIIGLGVGLVLVLGLGYFFKTTMSTEAPVTKASVADAPDVASVPGVGTPSAEYVKAQELANIELAKQAASTATESAIPTITRTMMKEIEDTNNFGDSGCDVASLKKARDAGVTAAELRCRGCSAAQMKSAGYSAASLRAAGFSAAELRASGYSAAELREAGFSAAELKTAGFSAAELKGAGFSAAELKAAGYSAEDLRTAGYSLQQLIAAGFSSDELKAIGFTDAQIAAAGYSSKCSVESIKEAKAKGASAESLRKLGCGPGALMKAGFTATELKMAGFSAEELKDAGFLAADLRAAGFSAEELRAAGYTAAQMRAAGFSAEELKAAGFSAVELRAAGFSAEELMLAGFKADELRRAGFSEGDLIRAGFASADMATTCDVSVLQEERQNGTKAEELKARGCSVLALSAAGYSIEELKDAGFDLDEIMAARPAQARKSTLDIDQPEIVIDDSIKDPLERLRLEQEAQLAQAKREQQMQEIEDAMLTQAGEIMSSWSPPSKQTLVVAKEKVQQAGGTKPVDLLPPSQVFKAKAGDVVYAVLSSEVNTDEASPVMATVVSGKLKGSKLLGSFALSGEKAVLSFVRISVPSVTTSSSIQGIAIDTNTAKTAMSSSVDHHYLLRYGTLFASSFLKGFSEAVASEGTVTEVGDRTEKTFSKKSNKDRMYVGLGEVGKQYSKVMAGNFQTPITVKVKKGTGFGLLFTNDVKIPLVDVDQ